MKSIAVIIAMGLVACSATAAQLDHAPRQLQISLRRTCAQTSAQALAAARVQAHAGSEQTVRVQVLGTADTATTGEAGTHQVVVQEGSEAFFDIASPMPQFAAAAIETRSSGSDRVIAGIGVRELHDSFRIVPRLSGNHVELDITEQQQHADGESISTQRASYRLVGDLGTWLQIGGATTSTRTGAVSGHSLTTRADELVWRVRVDAVNE